VRTERGDVTKGAIELAGEAIHRREAGEIVRRGIVQVMEGRHVFEHLTVEENLLTGAYTRRENAAARKDLDLVYTYFPVWWSAGASGPATSRAGSSRCWPSAGPSWRGPS